MLFVVATVLNINLLQGNSVSDVSLDDIAVMAQAYGESTNPDYVYLEKIVAKPLFEGSSHTVNIGATIKGMLELVILMNK